VTLLLQPKILDYTTEDTSSRTWLAVSNSLKKEYGEETFKSWISKLDFVRCANGHLEFTVPTRFIRDWIATHYEKRLLKLWRQHDINIKKINITVDPKKNPNPDIVKSSERPNIGTPVLNEPSAAEHTNTSITNLDRRFTFENFVVGKPNELAYAAAKAVADAGVVQAGSNPLFLYGGVGLGKTHLMHAIAWHINKNNPKRKVAYLSAEKYMYQFVKALRNKDIMSFKEQFRSVDVLMVDDVQFICGKDSTQEEFFHTFNELIDNNRQIVISCDRSPSDLEDMEERIRSRLGWGLVADVHSTTYELRIGILQSKLDQMNISIPKNVVEFLAAKISSNVRELEGALNKVIAHSNLIGREVTLEVTKEILRDLLRSNERAVTIEDIQKKVSERFNVKVSDMSSSRRLRSVSRPRQVAMYLSKSLTQRSFSEIGKKFGGKDHTTVMHAVKKVEELISADIEFGEDIRLLKRILEC
jgi:chromosomal replication initiator protein